LSTLLADVPGPASLPSSWLLPEGTALAESTLSAGLTALLLRKSRTEGRARRCLRRRLRLLNLAVLILAERPARILFQHRLTLIE
jgi:hypothetical protein